MPSPELTALCASVAAHSGVARTTTLQLSGHSRTRIATAVTTGALQRVCRGWVALPSADPQLVSAARASVVLTCITQARRLGLWVLHEDRCHVAASAHRGGPAPPRATVHWARPIVPRMPDALVDPLENVLAQVATCQPFESALTIWDSALQQGLVSLDRLRQLPFGPAARLVRDAAHPFSDSGLETIFRTRLRWMRVRILSQIWIAGHRVDFLIGERLVVQLDGGHHVGAQRADDIAHDAELMMRGYHVLRFTYGQIIDHWPDVQAQIMAAVARGLHLPRLPAQR
ncbi:MAG: DUF559 domain-containing protein [Microbacterium sp.]